FYSYTLMENAHTDSVVLDLPEYLTEDFESQSGTDFDCFHYSRTEVVVNGTAYDGRTQKNQCVVAPDGSTVVNVYYDRELMRIRFKYSNNNIVEFTGLYEQTFAQNGYKWSDVPPTSGYLWHDSNSFQTLLDAFTEKTSPYVLSLEAASTNCTIYHYKQGLNGKYSTNDRYSARASNGNFTFSNKFLGFTVTSYRIGNSGFNENGGSSDAHEGKTADLSSTSPLHVYHERK
ncbi:MAG: hypothetical protein II346_01065, partial [Ruminococcus sp.]|nr:hypothetical protein [Ruminococcus sp.]